MKRIILGIIVLSLTISGFSQSQYQVLVERPNEKTFKGIISKQALLSDTSFKWYVENLKAYTPNSNAVASLKKQVDSINLVVFMGTWCEDSHFIIPKFFNLVEVAGFPESRLSLIGVDRSKKTLGNLTDALNVKNVPTIIVMKNGKEIGRVVEFGKYGVYDLELAEILKKLD